MFHIRALRDFYTYVVNPQMHTDKICLIVFKYLATGFGRFCDNHQGALQEYC
jgi:hypothetical protein